MDVDANHSNCSSHINIPRYHQITGLIRDFFQQNGFIDISTPSDWSIIGACYDPKTVALIKSEDCIWPLPQTNQVWLQYELLNSRNLENSSAKGYFFEHTSYNRGKSLQGKKPPRFLPGIETITKDIQMSPILEFETNGTMSDLMNLEMDLICHLGYDKPTKLSYEEALEIVNKNQETEILDNADEQTLCREQNSVILLYNHPERTNPFWNIKRDENTSHSCKVDVLMYGLKTIISAERSMNPKDIKHFFFTMKDGEYVKSLYNQFGIDRPIGELYQMLNYLSSQTQENEPDPMCGGTIDLVPLIQSYEMLQNDVNNYNAGCTIF